MQENQPSSDSVPTVTTVSTNDQQPKTNGFLTILLSILLITSLAIAGFFAFQTQKLVKELTLLRTEPTPMATVEPTTESVATDSSITVDPTAGWKTYTNKAFSFKYPALWDTLIIGESTGSTLMVAPKEKVDKVKEISGGFGGGTFLTLTINTKSDAPVWKSDEYWQVTSESVVVNNLNGIKYNINVLQDLPGLTKGDKTTSVVVKSGRTYIQIDLLDQAYKSDYDQILSTFKFTN